MFIAGLSGLGFRGWRAGAARAALAALTLGPVAHVAVSAAHPPSAAVQAQAAIPGWHTRGTLITQAPGSPRFAAFTRPRLDAKAARPAPGRRGAVVLVPAVVSGVAAGIRAAVRPSSSPSPPARPRFRSP